MKELQEALGKATAVQGPSTAQTQEIERRDARELTLEQFYNDYALASKPVVITGLEEFAFPSGVWSLKDLEVVSVETLTF